MPPRAWFWRATQRSANMPGKSTCKQVAATPCRPATSPRSRRRSGRCWWHGSRKRGNSMTQTLLRGRTLSFLRWPDDTDDHAAYLYEEDGGLLLEGGKIVAAGAYADVSAKAADSAERIDHRPHLLLPGFIDAHVHFPQMGVIASYGTELLDWLNKYTFPEETKFRNAQHGRRIARLFLDEMVRQGTTTVAAYCSVHKQSAEAFFAESHDRNMLNIAGKVMMDRNAPDGVLDTPQSGYDDTKALIKEWHGKGRQLYAITP